MILVLGLGNIVMADDGIGVHAVRALRQQDLPEGVVALEVGTAFLDALPEIEQARQILVLDALRAGKSPGTVYRIPYEDCRVKPFLASLHGFDLSRVLALAGRQGEPPRVTVIGVEPARIEWSLELSPEVAFSLGAVVDAAQREIRDMQERAGTETIRLQPFDTTGGETTCRRN